MITEMFIEGQQVDVSEYLSTLITYAIDDIKDFSSRNTSFSKTIVLPGTARNNKIFGSIFEMESANPYNDAMPNVLTNFNAAKSAGCYIFQDNIQVFKGVVRLLEIIVDKGRKEYEVAVFGELGGLIAALGNKRLEELDFSAYNQTFSVANIASSWDNTSGAGLYYPLMDYGTYSTDKKNWQYHTFRPALFVKEYIDKIFAGTRYTYNCALFGTARFKQLIIPHNQKQVTNVVSDLVDAIRSSTYTAVNGGITSRLPFNSWTLASSVAASGTSDYFTYGSSTTLDIEITCHIEGNFVNNDASEPITIVVGTNGVAPTISSAPAILGPGDSGDFSFDFTVLGKLYNTQTIEVMLQWLGTATASINVTNCTLHASPVVTSTAEISIGQSLNINDSIPKNILQKDFFSSIVKLFNLYVYESRDDERLLNITPYIDYYDVDPGHAVDWSYKLNRDKPIRIKPLSELNSRYYRFSFKSDSDYWNDLYTKRYNQNYGDYIYDSAFEFAQEENKVEVIFSGTPLVGYVGESKVYSTIFKQTGSGTIQEETVDSNIRILQTKKITGVPSWNILNGATVLGSYTYYGYAGHLDDPNAPANDIQFGVPKELFFTLVTGALHVNQFNVYWSPYMAEITDKDSRLLTASFRLNARDIYNLDFSKMVYLDGGLYRLVKIEDYNASREDECAATLLKVIQTLY